MVVDKSIKLMPNIIINIYSYSYVSTKKLTIIITQIYIDMHVYAPTQLYTTYIYGYTNTYILFWNLHVYCEHAYWDHSYS